MRIGVVWAVSVALFAPGIGCGGATDEASEERGGCPTEPVIDAPKLGFMQTWKSGTFPVLSASQHSLELQIGGDVLEFLWQGPDLTATFAPGQLATIGAQADWEFVVAAEGAKAGVLSTSSAAATTLPPFFGPGPKLTYAAQCKITLPDGTCRALFALDVGGTDVGYGDTKSIAGWHFTNVGVRTGDCQGDADFAATVTALSE